MPPSGFSHKQGDAVVVFLRTCIEDLVQENLGLRTPAEAVRRELRHIAKDTRENRRSDASAAALALAKAHYEQLTAADVETFDELVAFSERTLERIKSDIEAIKVLDA